MELTFDRGIYSDAVLSTAAYWLSGEYAVERTLEGSTEVWKITRADAAPFDEAELRARLLRELYDQYLVTPEEGEPEFKVAYPRKTSSRKAETIF